MNDKAILIINSGGTISSEAIPAEGYRLAPRPIADYLKASVTFQRVPSPSGTTTQNLQSSSSSTCIDNPVEEEDAETEDEQQEKAQLRTSLLVNENQRHLYPEAPFVILEKPELMLDSANMSVNEWNLLGFILHERMPYYAGFVLTHGTDTMAYSAAAISFMLWGQTKPVVLTGAQRPLRPYSAYTLAGNGDAWANLLGAMDYARSPGASASVVIYFNTRIILGTRAQKKKCEDFEAFASPSVGILGYFNGKFNMNVTLVHLQDEQRKLELKIQEENNGDNGRSYFESASVSQTTAKAFYLELRTYEEFKKTHTFRDIFASQENLLQSPTGENPSFDNSSSTQQQQQVVLSGGSNAMPTGTPQPPNPKPKLRGLCLYYNWQCEAMVFTVKPSVRPGRGAQELFHRISPHIEDRYKPFGIIVLGYGGGNAQPEVTSLMKKIRNEWHMPIGWTSQIASGSSSGNYVAGMTNEHGVNLLDITEECAYTRLLHAMSMVVNSVQHRGKVFERSEQFRTEVEEALRVPYRLCYTPDPEDASLLLDHETKAIMEEIRQSAVTMKR